MSSIALRIQNISKKYRIGTVRHDTLRDQIASIASSRFRRTGNKANPNEDEIWALKDVSFDVHHGEIVGIIGRNGAGKSTLLKILSRITVPTSGRVEIYGRVGSLLEVGTGFHPELTGRENIYLNGAILGMHRTEIERKFDEIVAFSEIEKFLDTPVKRYSSGMYVRLAFAVAAHLEPEILLVDEVLAVGDVSFQKKCLGKMKVVADSGRTVIFISHNMNAIVSLCGRSLLLENGYLIENDDSERVVNRYLRVEEDRNSHWMTTERKIHDPLTLISVQVKDSDGNPRSNFNNQEPIYIELFIRMDEDSPFLKIGFDLTTEWDMQVFRTFHNDQFETMNLSDFRKGIYKFTAKIPSNLLNSNTYYVTPIATIHRKKWIFEEKRIVSFTVSYININKEYVSGKQPGMVRPIVNWSASQIENI